jgi:2-iminobutanoate/2-iminopropanoate deaminase
MFRLKFTVAAAMATAWILCSAPAQSASQTEVTTLAPAGAIKPTGPWNLGTRAGNFVYVAGMRGIDPRTNKLVEGDEARVRQAFMNMKLIAASEGASLHDAVRLVVYVTDMFRYRPIVNRFSRSCGGEALILHALSWRSFALTTTISSKSRVRSTRSVAICRPRRRRRCSEATSSGRRRKNHLID